MTEILSVGTDITGRRRTEEALEQSRTQLSLVLNNVSDVVFAIAVEGNDSYRFASVNQRFLEITGLPEGQIVGVSARDVIPASAHALVFGKYREAIESGLPAHWEEVSEYPTGKKIGAVTVVPVMDALGVCTQLVGMVHDITERTLADQAIREMNVTLERRVEERTAELVVAKDQAEAADRLKSAFLATMSHELRTPLNSIIGFTGIVLQGLAGPLNEEQRKQLDMVRDSARHLLALINDVLDISKIEAGQLEVSSESFDLRASIAKVTGSVKPLADKKDLELRVILGPEIASLVSDPRRVEQVLLNLLNNAIKFTEHGEVTLTADVVPSAPKSRDSEIRISVADTGIGIKAEDLGMLFQPFRQIETGLSRQHEGTGLGLAICRRLADLLGGEIDAESEWGKGSKFTLVLPLKSAGRTVTKTVLLIEDNPQNRYLVTFLLEAHGYSVTTAADGPQGIDLAGRLLPQLILLDIQLPTMDGYAVARALRANPILEHTPIVAVTSYAMSGDREKAIAAGCNGYVEKPINPETFVAEIERYLEAAP